MLPLRDIIVLDFTRLLPGAVATQVLAHFGAEVIKIESPGAGDPARHLQGGDSLFAESNFGKKSVAIDFKDPRGRQVLCGMSERADVLVENFRAGVMDNLGLGYGTLRGLNPRLIYASLRGYANSDEACGMAGHDLNYVAMAGILDLISAPNSVPNVPEIQIADLAGGSTQLIIGILLALEARHQSGRGQHVHISMIDGMGGLLAVPLSVLRREKRRLRRGDELLSGAYACYNVYVGRDGRWMAVGALEKKFWANLCRQLGCEELIDEQYSPDPKRREIKQRIATILAGRTAEEWFSLLRDHDCCLTPVRSLDEALANGYFACENPGIALSDTPAEYLNTSVPELGQHSAEVLERCGIPASVIDDLKARGVIG